MINKNVLIIDDECGVRESLSVALQNDCRVTTAESGEEGLKLIKENLPGLVVLDINLPGMDGIEALRNFRIIDASLPVIMISGMEEIKNIAASFRLGVIDFFCKPFNINEFSRVVNQALSKEEEANTNNGENTVSSGLDDFIEKKVDTALQDNLELKDALKSFDDQFVDEILNGNIRNTNKNRPS
ncbi:MAG: response regulator [Elusimicrobia bacterium]|nr:response regulator [Candidatus Liberimonas magnetica]